MTSASPTLFERVDSAWERFWSSLGLPGASIGIYAETSLIVAQKRTGWEWALVFSLAGIGVRMVTLVPSVYGERAMARMVACLPQLRPHYHEMIRVTQHPEVTDLEKAFARRAFTERRKAEYTKAGTGTLAAASGLASLPLALTALTAVGRVTQNEFSVQASTFLWCGSLAAADPTYILPIAAESLTLLNFNLMLRNREGMTHQKDQVIRRYRTFSLLAAAGLAPAVSTLPSGLCLYWVGMGFMGLAQPILTRTEFCRRVLGFPPSGVGTMSLDDIEIEKSAMPPPSPFSQRGPMSEVDIAVRERKYREYHEAKSGMEDQMDKRMRGYKKFVWNQIKRFTNKN